MTVLVVLVAACGGGTGDGGATTSAPSGNTQPSQPGTTQVGSTTTGGGGEGPIGTTQPPPTGSGDSFFVLDGQRVDPDELHMCPGLDGEEGGDDDFRVIAFATSGGQDLILQIQMEFSGSDAFTGMEIVMAADSTQLQVSSIGELGGGWDAGPESTVDWDGTRLTGSHFQLFDRDGELPARVLDSFDFVVPTTVSPKCT